MPPGLHIVRHLLQHYRLRWFSVPTLLGCSISVPVGLCLCRLQVLLLHCRLLVLLLCICLLWPLPLLLFLPMPVPAMSLLRLLFHFYLSLRLCIVVIILIWWSVAIGHDRFILLGALLAISLAILFPHVWGCIPYTDAPAYVLWCVTEAHHEMGNVANTYAGGGLFGMLLHPNEKSSLLCSCMHIERANHGPLQTALYEQSIDFFVLLILGPLIPSHAESPSIAQKSI
mmetsp:Transcript_40601/g.65867  ORF Transcript_40601/g.65867 Transcript_40601/m.65867 type:complete len:228 (-) Transcript_40601:653-1336(-)